MKPLHLLVAAALLAQAGTLARLAVADTITINSDSFAAVAYSPATGEFHYAYGYYDRWSAEKAVLEVFKAKDARVVRWVNDGFCALALGDDKSAYGTGYEYGNGASTSAAMATAIAECKKRTTGAHVVLCLSSDGQYIRKPEPLIPTVKASGSGGGSVESTAPPPAAKSSQPVNQPDGSAK